MAGVTHKLIAQTAREMAAEAYEVLAQDNAFHRMWPNLGGYVQQMWPAYVADARAILAGMLRGDLDEGVKQIIAEALMLDRPLRDKKVGTLTEQGKVRVH